MHAPADPPTERVLAVRCQIGRNIAARRQGARLSQEHLAELAGISRQTMYRIETGVRSARVDWLVAIADALRVPLSDFFRDV